MTLYILLIWMTNLFFDTVGQLSFKAAAIRNSGNTGLAHWQDMFSRPWIWLGIFSYVMEFVAWVAFLSLVQLSVGVMLASFNMVVIMVGGRVFFKEKLTLWRLLGLAFITLGVIFVGMDV